MEEERTTTTGATAAAEEFLTCALVARMANVTPETVREWNRRGDLQARRTASGIRLFEREHVDALLRKRAEQQAEKRPK